MKCPNCSAVIEATEQSKNLGNFYVCANCYVVIYRHK